MCTTFFSFLEVKITPSHSYGPACPARPGRALFALIQSADALRSPADLCNGYQHPQSNAFKVVVLWHAQGKAQVANLAGCAYVMVWLVFVQLVVGCVSCGWKGGQGRWRKWYDFLAVVF